MDGAQSLAMTESVAVRGENIAWVAITRWHEVSRSIDPIASGELHGDNGKG